MATQKDTTLAEMVEAARTLGDTKVAEVMRTLDRVASHPDDAADALPHALRAVVAGHAVASACVTHARNAAQNRLRTYALTEPTDPADMTDAPAAEREPRTYWEDVRDALPMGGAPISAAIAHHLGRKGAYDALDSICASGPALNVTAVCGALGMPLTDPAKGYTPKQRKVAREVVCGMVADASQRMGTVRRMRYSGPATKDGRVPTGPAETLTEHAARVLLWVNRRKGSAPRMAGQALGFIDPRNPLAKGPDASLGYRPAVLAKTGGARRDAPVKTSSSVTTGLTFGTGEVGAVALMYAPGDACPVPVSVPCGCVGACDCSPVMVCGCERTRQTLTDGRGVLCHRERVLATTEAKRAKVASAAETAAESVSAAYDAVRATWDPATATTSRDEVEMPEKPADAYALTYAPGKPCAAPARVALCGCWVAGGALASKGGALIHTEEVPAHLRPVVEGTPCEAPNLTTGEALPICRCGSKRGHLVALPLPVREDTTYAGPTLCHRVRVSGH